MPYRNPKDLKTLDSSLKKLSEHSKSKHILLAGDFNCSDIDWDTLTVRQMHQTTKYNRLSLTFLLSMDLHKYMTNQRAKKT